MFWKEGRGPESKFLWRVRDWRRERRLRVAGRVPEMEAVSRLMAVTKEEVESQETFVQSQKGVVVDQPAGAGEREAIKLSMTSESSVEERRRQVRKWRRTAWWRWRGAIGSCSGSVCCFELG